MAPKYDAVCKWIMLEHGEVHTLVHAFDVLKETYRQTF